MKVKREVEFELKFKSRAEIIRGFDDFKLNYGFSDICRAIKQCPKINKDTKVDCIMCNAVFKTKEKIENKSILFDRIKQIKGESNE